MAIALYDKAENRRLFEITLAQRNQLVDALEEESATDRDYYIDATVLDYLDGKVDADLLAKLRRLVEAVAAVGEAPGGNEVTGENEVASEDDELPGLDIEWREE